MGTVIAPGALNEVMATETNTLQPPEREQLRHQEPLLREALGEALRGARADRGITLRELAVRASVSPGYLSELERVRKEVSSELLASICYALRVSVPRILLDAAGAMSLGDAAERLANGGRTPVRV